jgi:hypothetical protein
MKEIEFTSWGKIARLFRDTTITEKIDGTNAAVGIREFQFGWHVGGIDKDGNDRDMPGNARLVLGPDTDYDGLPDTEYLVYAQSRSRIITPAADNFGFARWVWENAATLVADLGKGLHFGEWWGKGIQRGYNVPDKRLSLFNTAKWGDAHFATPNLLSVPVLSVRTFRECDVLGALWELEYYGSRAAPRFKPAEGVCIYHHASREIFKATILNDNSPKSKAA